MKNPFAALTALVAGALGRPQPSYFDSSLLTQVTSSHPRPRLRAPVDRPGRKALAGYLPGPRRARRVLRSQLPCKGGL
jgi:hypothetical protein